MRCDEYEMIVSNDHAEMDESAHKTAEKFAQSGSYHLHKASKRFDIVDKDNRVLAKGFYCSLSRY
jgi:hypothetical protein